MALTLVTGRANAGKTGAAYDVVRAGLRAGSDVWLVVPNRADVDRARRDLMLEFPMGLRVARFEDALGSMWDRCGDGRRAVSTAQRTHLMRACAAAMPEPPSPGVIRLACRVVERLAGAGGEAWRRATGDGEVAELVARYAAESAVRGLVEPGEAAALIETMPERAPDTVVIHRFSELTPAQERLVTGLAAAGRSVLVTLTWEAGFAPTEGVTELVERLAGLGEHRHLAADASYTPSAELARLEAELFAPGPPRPAAGDVVFSAAEGDEAEADRIAAEVLDLIASGVPSEQIAVAFRDPDRHRTAVEHAFREAGIDADHDHSRAFGSTAFGRALMSLLAFAGGGERDDLLGFLRSAYSGADRSAVAALETRWRRQGTRDTALLLGGIKGLGWAPESAVRAVTSGPLDGNTWQALAEEMLVAAHGRGGGELHGAADDARAYAALIRLIEGLARIGEQTVDARGMAALLRDATVGVGDVERPGHVQVMDAERLKGRRFEAVVLGGLTDDEFPRLREDALGSPIIGALFRSVGAAEPRWGGAAMERALLYDVVTRPRRRLVLSRRTMDSSGTPLGPSAFWEELRDLYRAPDAEAEKDVIAGADRELSFGDAGLAEHRSSSARSPLRSLARGGAPSADPRVAAARRRAAVQPHLIMDEERLSRLAGRDVFSPSEIEAYLKCPYRWFVSRTLDTDTVDFTVDHLLLGSTIHDALRDLYRLLPERTGCPRVTARTLDAASELAASCLDERIAASDASAGERDGMRAALRPLMTRHLGAEAESLLGFTPRWLEWSFGFDEDGGPEPFDGFSLRGSIDRIDVSEDGGLLVIDYKKGTPAPLSSWEREGLVQLPLYAAVARRRLEAPVLGMFYRGLSKAAGRNYVGPYIVGRVEGGVGARSAVEADEIDAIVDRALALAADAVAGMRAGEIPATGTGRPCETCGASSYCGRAPR